MINIERKNKKLKTGIILIEKRDLSNSQDSPALQV